MPVLAATSKGDELVRQAIAKEAIKTLAALDSAADLATQAEATDPSDLEYQLTGLRIRATAGQAHVYQGIAYRNAGRLEEALREFKKALELDHASPVAQQEVERTQAILMKMAANPGATLEDLLLTPQQRQSLRTEARISSALPAPRLSITLTKPLPSLRVNQQPSSEVFAALARVAGLKIFFDPEYRDVNLGRNGVLDFHDLTPETALDYLAAVTRSFWKPLSSDAIFVTNDDPTRRALYEDEITKVFYLTHATEPKVLTEIADTVRNLTDIRRIFVHTDLNALLIRADASRMALAEKIIEDLDKPRSEIVVDVIFLQVDKDWVRRLGLQLDSGVSITATPSSTLSPNAPSGPSVSSVLLSQLARLGTGDYSVTLPGMTLSALLQKIGSKVLDRAQLRMLDNRTAVLNSGAKVPYASSSFLPGTSGGAGSALVNTQFQFLDVGFNLSVTAHVHEGDGDVDMHVESDLSSVTGYSSLGGITQPVISHFKRSADVQVKDGDLNFWDAIDQKQDNVTRNGTPGLSSIPGIGRLFTGERRETSQTQILTLLMPNVIRNSQIKDVNVMAVATGSDQTIRLNYSGAPEVSGSGQAAEIVDVTSTLPPAAPQPAVYGTPSPYGAPQGTSPFGVPQQTSPFGAPQTQSPFGTPQQTSPFGAPQTQSPFGAPQQTSPFGTPQTQSPFGAPH